MSIPSTLSTSGNKQLVKLGTRLVVGIGLNGTLVSFPKRGNVAKYRMRPYLRYFGAVLKKFKCEVALITRANQSDVDRILARFNQEFTCPYRCIFDHGGDGSLDYSFMLNSIASEVQSRRDRVLLVDVETSHDMSPRQQLILERMSIEKRLRASERAVSGATVEQKQVAITAEDFSLVALAEMIKEMATCDVAVGSYLKMEPLIETVRVPMFGEVYCLPVENCDHIDQLDLAALEVSEPLLWKDAVASEAAENDHSEQWKKDGLHKVRETDAHKDLFK